MHAIAKYLQTWAEPEAAQARALDGTYERCLVVPACREEASMLDGYVQAAATSTGRTLLVLVVNGSEGGHAEAHAENARFLDGVVGRLTNVRRVADTPRVLLGETSSAAFDVAVVDRASEGVRLPPKTGVGLARKIGADVALSLHVAGKLRSPFVFFTDADAMLPQGHFDRAEPTRDAAAVVFPFWHDPGADLDVTHATALYELSLRYYVSGLGFAGSPYAFHTLGSAMAVHAWAYAAVRGVPKREAGEDFYLLGKVAKVGALVRADGAPVCLRSRTSDRTPFGTGAGVARGLAESSRRFYAPECFVALRRWLGELSNLAEHGSLGRFEAARGGLSGAEWDAVRASLVDPRGREGLDAAVKRASSGAERRFRLHEWFDAFRTLKFIHALRGAIWPSVAWVDARARAPFLPSIESLPSGELTEARRALLRQEALTAPRFGPRARSVEPAVAAARHGVG